MRRARKPVFPEPGQSATSSVLRVRPASPPPAGPGPGDQTALALEPRELWIAVHVPQLSVLAVRAGQASTSPLAIIDPRNQRIFDAEDRARSQGVRPGMNLGAALAAAPDVDMRPRDEMREREVMQRLAAVAAQFTPMVSHEPPDGLLLEIKPSIELFGGLRELCARLRAACLAIPTFAPDGTSPIFTLAPTPLAALAAARAGARCFITNPAALAARLKPLPLAVLRWPEEQNARLAAMGVRTLGELMRLPRAGFAQRFGPARLADLDRLLGRRFEPRRRAPRREYYRGRIDPDHELESHHELLLALRPLLGELEHFLLTRQRGITALQCRFHHRHAPPTICELRLRAPEADAARLTALLSERLATLLLPEPVRRCELRGGAPVERVCASNPLWSAGERGHVPTDESHALIERLRARLGVEAVYGLCRVPEHRPENAWRVSEPGHVASCGATAPAWSPFRRPLWLLREPEELSARGGRPCHRGVLSLSAGPERLESGWWDGGDVERDYYVATDARGALLWIYRERGDARRWFLHGVFG